jgi:hypothetical protein
VAKSESVYPTDCSVRSLVGRHTGLYIIAVEGLRGKALFRVRGGGRDRQKISSFLTIPRK